MLESSSPVEHELVSCEVTLVVGDVFTLVAGELGRCRLHYLRLGHLRHGHGLGHWDGGLHPFFLQAFGCFSVDNLLMQPQILVAFKNNVTCFTLEFWLY